jgi:hypothetical protein
MARSGLVSIRPCRYIFDGRMTNVKPLSLTKIVPNVLVLLTFFVVQAESKSWHVCICYLKYDECDL